MTGFEREGRILNDPDGDSNIVFREPRETVLASWRRVIADLYSRPMSMPVF